MTGPLVAMLVPVGFGAAGLVGAAYLFRTAARGARRGDVPHCSGCDYDLTGLADLPGGQCPECGGALDERSVARGERVGRPVVAVAGLVLTLVMLPLVVLPVLEFVRVFDWYGLKPIGRVIDDAESGAPPVARRAWDELVRRGGSALSPVQHDRVAALALAEQRKPTTSLTHPVRDWLGAAAAAEGALTPEQREQFFRQFVRTELRVRKTVVAGDPVPFQFDCRDRTPYGPWWARVDPVELTWDGAPADEAVPGARAGADDASAPDLPGPPVRDSNGSFESSVRADRADRPGRHTLRLAARVNVFYGIRGGDRQSAATPVHRHDVVLTAETEVVAAAPEGYVKKVRDEKIAQRLRDCAQPGNFWWLTVVNPRGELCGQVDLRAVPANVALEVLARVGGKEYPLGSVALPLGGSTCVLIGTAEPALESAGQFDLVLRSSESVARRTVDLFETWDGELVFAGVVVRHTNGGPAPHAQ